MSMQLDLFNDSRDVMLQNDVIAALRARDAAFCKRTLDVFAAEFPGHDNLEPLRNLLTALNAPASAEPSHDELKQQVHRIEAVITPAAIRVLGQRESAQWLAPLWRMLASCAAGRAFNPGAPETHAAYMQLKSGDFAQAQTTAAAIASWRRIPCTLSWMAEARFHVGGLESAWPLLLELAWLHGGEFGKLSRRLPSPVLKRLLPAFARFGEDDPPDYTWFPAWLLITTPDLLVALRQTQVCGSGVQERVARLVADLLFLEKQGQHQDIVARRRTLRDLDPALFALYMSTR